MPRSSNSQEWNKGYRACKKKVLAKVIDAVAQIEQDINRQSGLSPMLWSDREAREAIIEKWCALVTEELTRL